ncbi:unnamed protein product [Ectocarpus sp. 13 AM-2016]
MFEVPIPFLYLCACLPLLLLLLRILTVKLEATLRALLLKHTSQMAAAEATSQKLSKMAAIFQQLQGDQGGGRTTASVKHVAPAHGEASLLVPR